RAATEAELRTMVAGRAFPELLTSERGAFQKAALERVKRACADAEYHTQGLGVEFDSLAVLDLHPPSDVVESYYEVAKAMQRRDERINEGYKTEIEKRKGAEAEGHQ